MSLVTAPGYSLDDLRLPKNQKFMNRAVQHLLRAAIDAVKQPGLEGVDPDRIGVYTASGQLGPEPTEFFNAFKIAVDENGRPDWAKLGGPAARYIDPSFPLRTLSNAGSALLSMEFGARGPTATFVQSDIAGVLALRSAMRDLEARRCDLAIVGACDNLTTPAVQLAYQKQGLALPLAEGAGVVLLERKGDRFVQNFARIRSTGVATDPSGAFRPFATPDALISSAREACDGTPALLVPSGFGIPDIDARENEILQTLYPEVPQFRCKPETGYLGAATAIVESILAIKKQSAGALCLTQTWAGQSAAVYWD